MKDIPVTMFNSLGRKVRVGTVIAVKHDDDGTSIQAEIDPGYASRLRPPLTTGRYALSAEVEDSSITVASLMLLGKQPDDA